MLIEVSSTNNDVINDDGAREARKYLLRRSLKNSRGSIDTVWHPKVAKTPEWGGKSREKRGISVQFDLPKLLASSTENTVAPAIWAATS